MSECFYEILGIQQTATAEEIKKAHRTLALKHHPDKLQHRNASQEEVVAANQKFAKIQEAYEVLSDVQERAWYDAHRQQILHGGTMDVEGGNSSDDEGVHAPEVVGLVANRLMPYFSSMAYNGFTGQNNFFQVYGELFRRIEKEENLARRERGESEIEGFPFGMADEDYTLHAQDFYNHYLNFVSYKSFSWRDKWRLTEAPDRRIKRAMIKDNEKRRSGAKKAYVDTVRRLATFIRKRDPRWKQYQQDQEMIKQEKMQQEVERRRQEKLDLLKRAEEYQDSQEILEDVAALSHDEDAMGLETDSQDSTYETEEEDDLTCYACNKSFSTPGQYQNHVQSKKHKKQVEKLKEELALEEEELEQEELEALEEYSDEEFIEDLDEVVTEESVDEEMISEDEDDHMARMLAAKMAQTRIDSDSDDSPSPKEPTPISSPKISSPEIPNVPVSKKKKKSKEVKPEEYRCAVCNTNFTTRNKLFDHIKSSGHAVPLSKKK